MTFTGDDVPLAFMVYSAHVEMGKEGSGGLDGVGGGIHTLPRHECVESYHKDISVPLPDPACRCKISAVRRLVFSALGLYWMFIAI